MDADERGHASVKAENSNVNAGIGKVESARSPSIVTNLGELIHAGFKFSTVLADPPWRYSNTSSRGAAENHYPTMTVQHICGEPVRQLVRDRAHLHLWTTGSTVIAGIVGAAWTSCR